MEEEFNNLEDFLKKVLKNDEFFNKARGLCHENWVV